MDGNDDNVVDLGAAGVPVGIDPNATSTMLKAAISDDAAKAALLSTIRASATSAAGTQTQERSEETKKELSDIESKLEKARVSSDATEIGKLQAQAKDLQDMAEEQLQDGHLASVASENVKVLSEKALTNAVAAENVKATTASSDDNTAKVEDTIQKEKEAELLMEQTKQTLCDAATKAVEELDGKSTTLNHLASTLYDEMERQQKGSSKDAAEVSQN